jgi:transposase
MEPNTTVTLQPLLRCVAALDVHQNLLTACVLFEDENGETRVEIREFGGFKRDRREMAQWIASHRPEAVVMESTGIYWKSPYSALEKVGIQAKVVNARHVKNVPGRKTDIQDAQWLAIVARAGLLTNSFVPPENLRGLRLISRQIQKLTGMLGSEKNRVHKVLTDGGIRLSVVVSDLHGKSARAMIKGLLAGETPEQVLRYADGRLKATEEELLEALEGDLTDSHRLVVRELIAHVEYLEQRIDALFQELLNGLAPQKALLDAFQTIPGVDRMAAAMVLVEIGDDMSQFGSPDRLAAWAGLCPANNQTNKKQRGGKKRKGNPYVRRILCEVAHAASRTRSALAAKFKGLALRRGFKRAIFALAHRILKIMFWLIQRGDYYRDATVDYEAESVNRNAPRWIRMLKKHGYIPA